MQSTAGRSQEFDLVEGQRQRDRRIDRYRQTDARHTETERRQLERVSGYRMMIYKS